ncbi:Hsp20/alpha crystallin family protein [Halorussus gelatinilyticus]|uniref:Hsp20/alpha crystallin family protein n=1 Tax=Halorussus gelatinilyticus TaxID=2937524 RepID=A0A8U0IHT4_9EURY|nr:Hsp20/alpha crystallin family protein [Halorussus gelatinilyticus]UPW00265.1 Hsp20/alpha crystallin family protein [Halorussus gelatinilyticus]
MARRNRRRRHRPTDSRPEPEIAVDVAERSDEFVVTADLPGVRKQDIDVTVRKNRVQILAEPQDDPENAGTFAGRARERGQVSRSIRLPERVDEKRTNAEYLNGRLRITLPKRERRRSVDVE